MTGEGLLRPVRPGAGTFEVTIGPRRRDRLMALAAGQRRSGRVPVRMVVEPVHDGHRPPRERWVRTVDGRRLATTAVWDEPGVEAEGAACAAGAQVVTEWLGPLGLVFRLGSEGQRITMDLTGARLGTSRRSLPLPTAPFPVVSAVAGPVSAVSAYPAGPDPEGWWVRVELRSRHGRSILVYEGVLT